MMRIRVRYFNILSLYTNCKDEVITLSSALPLLELIHHLASKYPGGFAQVTLAKGELAPHLRVFVNNKSLGWQDGDFIINDNDEVMLFPAVAGG